MAEEAFEAGQGPGRPPTREELAWAGDFAALGKALDGCRNGADVAVLISTCRNHWMAVNAVFVDVRLAVGTTTTDEDKLSRALQAIRDSNFARARELADDAASDLSQASNKAAVWNGRQELWDQLLASVAALDFEDESRMTIYLAQQQELRGSVDGRADGEFLAISLNENVDAANLLAMLSRERDKAAAVASTLLVLLSALAGERTKAQTLFAEDDGTWADFVSHVTEREGEGKTATELLDLPPLDAAANEDEQTLSTAAVMAKCAEAVQAVRTQLASELRPNAPTRPLPPPYELDLTSSSPRSGDRGTSFSVERGRGRTHEAPHEARVALAKLGIPGDCYAPGLQYCYSSDGDQAGTARELILAAVTKAAEAGAEMLILPECSIPASAVDAVADAAEPHGLTVVGGVEHQARPDGKVKNQVVVLAPQAQRAGQYKQRPSVYQAREPNFFHDGRLWITTETPLGSMAVVVCSDYLEMDLIWALASHEIPVDALVVCSRNPNPQIFERLAVADAARLFANVMVVNSTPSDTNSDGSGTILAVPHRDTPIQQADATLDLDGVGWPGQPSQLDIVTVPVAVPRSRFNNRTAAGYLPAPAFARRATPAG